MAKKIAVLSNSQDHNEEDINIYLLRDTGSLWGFEVGNLIMKKGKKKDDARCNILFKVTGFSGKELLWCVNPITKQFTIFASPEGLKLIRKRKSKQHKRAL